MLSLAISMLWSFLIVRLLTSRGNDLPVSVDNFLLGVASDFRGLFTGGSIEGMTVSTLSTLFTSIWTALIFLSSIFLKLVAPIHRMTTWFFDVDNHPLEAVGNVAAGLVVAGSLGWSFVRAVV